MKALQFLVGILMALVILLGSFIFLLNNEPFFTFLLERTDVYENVQLPKEVIDNAVRMMISYFRGTSPDMLVGYEGRSIFHAQEVFHMFEVKVIFDAIRSLLIGLFIFVVSMLVVFKKDHHRIFKYQVVGMLLIFVVLGALALNFERTFLVMHDVLFDNQYWTFTSEHILIQILTFEFFLYFFIATFIQALVISLILGIAAVKGERDDKALPR